MGTIMGIFLIFVGLSMIRGNGRIAFLFHRDRRLFADHLSLSTARQNILIVGAIFVLAGIVLGLLGVLSGI
jgi:hypothetical protein